MPPTNPVAVLGHLINGRLQIIDFEDDVGQSELIDGRPANRQVVRPDEARELQRGAAVMGVQHHDLGPRVGNADDRVQELPLDASGHLGVG